ncbi:desampylase [Halorussus aquaticus]|uniref:Desampylase n=1 Tax=Halorussus aquaticus TaxID=2953748 RepID=A0ABD5Q5W5_9EURY|nr:desampylase [Halorussus aquaticus]
MPTDESDSPTVVVPRSVREEILARAREGAPEEVCGILAGTRDETDHRVETSHPAENVAETPRTRYEIGPREQLALMEEIEDAGREVVGFYHSHPRGPSRPSATDAAQATWPDRSYLVVSLGNDAGESAVSVESWRWTGEEFVAESVRVETAES